MNEDISGLAHMWTTERDDYSLVGNDDPAKGLPKYMICHDLDGTAILIEDTDAWGRIVSEMLEAGVKAFDRTRDWSAFRLAKEPGQR